MRFALLITALITGRMFGHTLPSDIESFSLVMIVGFFFWDVIDLVLKIKFKTNVKVKAKT